MGDGSARSIIIANESWTDLVLGCGDRISVLFGAKISPRENRDLAPAGCVLLDVKTAPGTEPDADLLTRLQSYVDDIVRKAEGGATEEDSSYDSDYDADDRLGHQDVSRTTSDTLGAEFAEYVHQGEATPGYAARVEFALKLGYTEKQVQAALAKLGPDPGQNELLAELIKLGAHGSKLPETPPDSAEANDSTAEFFATDASSGGLRPIVIDGSNVAMSHGNKEVFSCRGIKICVDWFRARGHREITVFVPRWRKEAPRPDNPITDQEILHELEKERLLVFTPSRLVGGKRMVCYDDRYILRLAAEVDGIVVSNDNYRDLAPDFRKVVEERILMYSFVNDRFMPPDDPLGRSGPTLDKFLRMQPRKGDLPPPCPYGKKCTYGNKCKFHHPERGPLPHKSVTERLVEHAQRQKLARAEPSPLKGKSLSLPLSAEAGKVPLSRTKSVAVSAPLKEPAKACQEQTVNLHRKLQRQLTLNPTCDPRLYQVHRYPQYGAAGSASQPWEVHQNVTRIASAPDSYRQWPVPPAIHHRHHMQRLSSTSDPQINLCAPQGNPQAWAPVLWAPAPAVVPQFGSSAEDARRKLHYHLAAIFPEEQVQQAMKRLPEETDPQKICAAILSMFPKT